ARWPRQGQQGRFYQRDGALRDGDPQHQGEPQAPDGSLRSVDRPGPPPPQAHGAHPGHGRDIDRALMQKYFDQVEYWLRSWTAPVVRIFTLGYINPRKMLAVEVRKALLEASTLINSTFWWVSLQTGLRVAFGLVLWLTYAVQHPIVSPRLGRG